MRFKIILRLLLLYSLFISCSVIGKFNSGQKSDTASDKTAQAERIANIQDEIYKLDNQKVYLDSEISKAEKRLAELKYDIEQLQSMKENIEVSQEVEEETKLTDSTIIERNKYNQESRFSQAIEKDMSQMTTQISEMTGISTPVNISNRDDGKKDINVNFSKNVTNYQGVMEALIGTVGENTRKSKYLTVWCYINTPNRPKERIRTSEIRIVQKMLLEAMKTNKNIDSGWEYFLSKIEIVK